MLARSNSRLTAIRVLEALGVAARSPAGGKFYSLFLGKFYSLFLSVDALGVEISSRLYL